MLVRNATPKPRPRVLEKAAKQRAKASAYRDASAVVRARDGGRCRACGRLGNQAHHIVYRSHGGKDAPENLIWCCAACHRLIHAKVLLVTFDPKAPARTVRFTRNTAWD